MIARRFLRALTRSQAETDPDHEDPGLRGRTYPVPFDRVWSTAVTIAEERWGWTITHSDDLDGVLQVEAKTPVFRLVDDVEVRICLDPDAQTRVDVSSASRVGKADLGTNARRIRRFLKHLDRRLEKNAQRKTSAGRGGATS